MPQTIIALGDSVYVTGYVQRVEEETVHIEEENIL
jgi:hypothetical protein